MSQERDGRKKRGLFFAHIYHTIYELEKRYARAERETTRHVATSGAGEQMRGSEKSY